MDSLGFDISGILSEDEADKIFEEQAQEEETAEPEKTQETEPAEEDADTPSEEVGRKNNETEGDAADSQDDGSSPSIYSSIATALKNDGIFPDFTDEELGAVKTPEDFAELFEKAIKAGLDDRQRRIDEALTYGVQPNTVRNYEQTIQYLSSINEEALTAESEEGENLRKQIIYNDLLFRGYSEDRAKRELEKSFKAGTDIDDARDALSSLTTAYTNKYTEVREQAKHQADEMRAAQKKSDEDFRKLLLDDEVKVGETVLDKRTCQRIYDAMAKPVAKDPNTGKLLTAVQQFQAEHPLEFLKNIGMWWVLTNGGKDFSGLTKQQLRTERNQSIKELTRKINTTSLNKDGSLKYTSTSRDEADPLLSDGWKVGW